MRGVAGVHACMTEQTFKSALVSSMDDIPTWCDHAEFSARDFDDEYRGCLAVYMDGKVSYHWDRGEPEDNLYMRDWDWVAPALDAAYAAGKADGLREAAKDRGAFDPPSSPEFIREGYESGVPTGTRDDRQTLIACWTSRVFGADMMAPHERIMRFIEEAAELAQAEGLPVERVEDIVSYVYARQVGDPAQELGGVGLTLLAYAAAKGLSADDAEAREVTRVLRKDPAYFRQRNLEKAAAGIGDYKASP